MATPTHISLLSMFTEYVYITGTELVVNVFST